MSLVILDFQMPFKNGIQVVNELRDFYTETQMKNPLIKLVNPRFVINTAFKSGMLAKYLNDNNI